VPALRFLCSPTWEDSRKREDCLEETTAAALKGDYTHIRVTAKEEQHESIDVSRGLLAKVTFRRLEVSSPTRNWETPKLTFCTDLGQLYGRFRKVHLGIAVDV
jgi:hypothetical protein